MKINDECKTQNHKDKFNRKSGKKFFVCIEGEQYPWPEETITVSQIRELAGLPKDLPVIEVMPDNTERTLAEDEVIELKPGRRFGKKICFKRG